MEPSGRYNVLEGLSSGVLNLVCSSFSVLSSFFVPVDIRAYACTRPSVLYLLDHSHDLFIIHHITLLISLLYQIAADAKRTLTTLNRVPPSFSLSALTPNSSGGIGTGAGRNSAEYEADVFQEIFTKDWRGFMGRFDCTFE